KRQLSNVDVLPVRFEASKIPPNELAFVTSRALGGIGDLLSWSRSILSSDGRVILWLGAEEAEKTTQIPGWRWVQVPIPGTVKRRILSGSPQARTRRAKIGDNLFHVEQILALAAHSECST